MLMLLFQVGDERWAIAASAVVTVLPNVELQKMSNSHPSLAGLLNYHDEILPAIDVSDLLGNGPAPPLLSTRIVIAEAMSADPNITEPHRVALIVDRAGETLTLSERVSLPMQNPYAEAAMQDPNGKIVQQLAIAPLLESAFLPDAERPVLEPAAFAPTTIEQTTQHTAQAPFSQVIESGRKR